MPPFANFWRPYPTSFNKRGPTMRNISQMIKKTIQFNPCNNSYKLYTERGHYFFSLKENQRKLKNNVIRMGGAIVEQLLGSEEKNKSSRAVRVSVRDLCGKVNHRGNVV